MPPPFTSYTPAAGWVKAADHPINNVPFSALKTLRRDLCRVNCEVNNLEPFVRIAFPHFAICKNALKRPRFGDELVTSFSAGAETKRFRLSFRFADLTATRTPA